MNFTHNSTGAPDINGIRALYGRRGQTLEVRRSGRVVGEVHRGSSMLMLLQQR